MRTAATTIGFIAVNQPSAIELFEKWRLDYAFHGNLTLREACADAGVDFGGVKDELDQLEPNPALILWMDRTLEELTRFLESQHHAFTRKAVHEIAEALSNAVQNGEVDFDTTFVHFRRIFFEFREELLEHITREEQFFFPYARLLERAILQDRAVPTPYAGTVASPAAHSVEDHERAERQIAALGRLAAAMPQRLNCHNLDKIRRLLRELERNMREHIHLENNVLFERAIGYERGALSGGPYPNRFENPAIASRLQE